MKELQEDKTPLLENLKKEFNNQSTCLLSSMKTLDHPMSMMSLIKSRLRAIHQPTSKWQRFQSMEILWWSNLESRLFWMREISFKLVSSKDSPMTKEEMLAAQRPKTNVKTVSVTSPSASGLVRDQIRSLLSTSTLFHKELPLLQAYLLIWCSLLLVNQLKLPRKLQMSNQKLAPTNIQLSWLPGWELVSFLSWLHYHLPSSRSNKWWTKKWVRKKKSRLNPVLRLQEEKATFHSQTTNLQRSRNPLMFHSPTQKMMRMLRRPMSQLQNSVRKWKGLLAPEI